MRFAVLMCLVLLMEGRPVQAADLAVVTVSLAKVDPSARWPDSVSEWGVAVGSQAVTCDLGGPWLQTTRTGRCARGLGASKAEGPLVVSLVDDTHFRVEFAGAEALIEVANLRMPSQARLGPYLVTLMRHSWQRVPGVELSEGS